MALAEKVGARLRPGDVIAYFGDLGVGKTTFTRGLAKGMGLPDVISSPTFAIVQEYHGEGLSLYHFDMYRVDGALDLESTGFYDYPLDEGIFAIEWSEHILEALPKNAISITLERLSDTARKITIEGDERFVDLGHGYFRDGCGDCTV
ncbi:MAG: tRNA (adenosine(37)-N6)-threonylcarbamoyltransferase complex ATPase subunit type 1 TsaE [Ruminococcus sp.]|nr:tRNA (adenosine(37)-N6)-threonylcarbamoyltransferase complex ATPase subunit type 1 TsaE [Ruminococcus sp.]